MIVEWYGVFSASGRLEAVEESEELAAQIAKRLSEGRARPSGVSSITIIDLPLAEFIRQITAELRRNTNDK